jgi:hypothetical protein
MADALPTELLTTPAIKRGISQQPLLRFSSNFKLKLRGPTQNKILLEMETTSDERQPQNINSVLSQQPLLGFFSNFILKLRISVFILIRKEQASISFK